MKQSDILEMFNRLKLEHTTEFSTKEVRVSFTSGFCMDITTDGEVWVHDTNDDAVVRLPVRTIDHLETICVCFKYASDAKLAALAKLTDEDKLALGLE